MNYRNRTDQGAELVWIKVNGILVQAKPASIDKSQRTPLHGKFKDVPVHSPAMCKLGTKPDDTVILWPNQKKSKAVSMSIAAAGVFATQFLESEGQIVKAQ